VAAGPDGNVAIYRGVPTSVLGISLSSVEEAQDVPLTALPTFNRDRIRENIEASDLADARRIVGNLRQVAADCAPAVATPAPTPVSTRPARTPTSRPSAQASSPAPRGDSLTVTRIPRVPAGCDGVTP
jgi:hypothetical protein